jgi:hypothetical protein
MRSLARVFAQPIAVAPLPGAVPAALAGERRSLRCVGVRAGAVGAMPPMPVAAAGGSA